MGTKTPFKVFLFLFLSFSREKGIPKHGDENSLRTLKTWEIPRPREKRIPKHGDEGKTCVTLIVG